MPDDTKCGPRMNPTKTRTTIGLVTTYLLYTQIALSMKNASEEKANNDYY